MSHGAAAPSVGFYWALAFLFTAAAQIGDGAAQTLFLSRVGPAQLPLMFALIAALDLAVAALYIPAATRLGQGRTLTLILSLAAGALALFYPLSGALGRWACSALFVLHESLLTLLKIHWGVYLLDRLPAEQTPRRLPMIYTGARVGGVAGGLVMAALARRVGPRGLLLPSSALYLLSALCAHVRKGAPPDEDQRREQNQARELAAGRLAHLRRGVSLGWSSPLLRAIALATALMVLSRYGLRYLYSASFAATYSERELAGFWGVYSAVANTSTILLQVTVLGRLLMRWGITALNLLYAAAVGLVYLALGLWPGLAVAVAARFVESELKTTVKTPLSIMFYGALPVKDRPAGRAFILGLVVPLATVAASLSLGATLGSAAVIYWGGACACCYIAAAHLQNQAFHGA